MEGGYLDLEIIYSLHLIFTCIMWYINTYKSSNVRLASKWILIISVE